MTAADIIARHQRYGWSDPPGEWGAIQNVVRKQYRELLDAGDAEGLAKALDGMFYTPLSFGLTSSPEKAESLPTMVTWRLALWAKNTANPDLERLRAPAFPAPTVETNGVPIMVDTPRFDCYAERICNVLPEDGTVLEIGGGYGGVALQLRRHRRFVQVVLCDIPETLYLAWWWLSKAGVDVAWDDERAADVTLVPAAELAELAGPVDVVFSAHTLSGTDRPTIQHYLDWLDGSGAYWFYHDDAIRTVTDAWLTGQFPEVLSSEIVPRGFREVWRERTPWTGPTDRFCEFMYER